VRLVFIREGLTQVRHRQSCGLFYPGDTPMTPKRSTRILSSYTRHTALSHDSGVAEIRIQGTSWPRDDGGRVDDPFPTMMSRVLKNAGLSPGK